jgi:hypothetical protein
MFISFQKLVPEISFIANLIITIHPGTRFVLIFTESESKGNLKHLKEDNGLRRLPSLQETKAKK